MDLRPPPSKRRYLYPFTAGTVGDWTADTPDDAAEVTIDMSRVQYIDCVGLTMIAAVAEDAANRNRRVRFVEPQQANVRSYMSRMHLRESLADFCSDVVLPRVNEWSTDRLSELQRFDAYGGGDELAERVFRRMNASPACSTEDAKSFFKGISEVVNNVAEHSGAGGGWAAMQVIPSSKDGLITFAVADAGHGLEITLSRRYWVEGSLDAMELAFQREVSGTSVAGRGTGLDDLHRRVKHHQGRLFAWSGRAAGTSVAGNGPIACREVTAAFPGTVIYAGFKPGARKVGP